MTDQPINYLDDNNLQEVYQSAYNINGDSAETALIRIHNEIFLLSYYYWTFLQLLIPSTWFFTLQIKASFWYMRQGT